MRIFSLVMAVFLLGITSICYAQVSPPDEQLPDPRLNAKVTLEEEEITLSELMKKLTEQTGVSLSIDSKKSAWSIRQRKVTLAAKDLPLGELQIALKQLLVYSWKRTGEPGSWSYVLYQRDKDKALEAQLLANKLESDKKQEAENFARGVDTFRRADSMSADDLLKLKQNSPWLYIAITYGPGKAIGRLFNNLPEIDQALSGSKVGIPCLQLSAENQKLVKEVIDGIDQMSQGPFGGLCDEGVFGRFYPERDTSYQDLNQINLIITRYRLRFVTSTKNQASIRLVDNNPNDHIYIDHYLQEMEDKKPQGQSDNIASSAKRPIPDKSILSDAFLTKEISPFSIESIRDLAKKLGISVITDHNPDSYWWPFSTTEKKLQVYELLDLLGEQEKRCWTKKKSLIMWQDREWFLRSLKDVPDEWVDALFQRFKASGMKFSLDEQVQMVTLTKDQLESISCETANKAYIYKKALGKVPTEVDKARQAERMAYSKFSSVCTLIEAAAYNSLKFYSTLSQQQRQLLIRNESLQTQQLTETQRQAARTLLDSIEYVGDYDLLLLQGSISLQSGKLLFTGPMGDCESCYLYDVKSTITAASEK